MKLLEKIRRFSLSGNALRTIGVLFLLAGLAGSLIQARVLGTASMTNAQLFEAMEADPSVMESATLAILCQCLEACAVPIFVFLLVEGVTHTSSFAKYFLRVLGLAVVCQLPYNLLMTGSVLAMNGLNPVFATFMSMVMLYFFRRFPEKKFSHIAIKAIAIIFAYLWSNILGVSHGASCVILAAVLWALRGKQNLQTFVGIMVTFCCCIYSLFYMIAPISFLFLHFYDGEQGYSNKLVNYAAYPALLLVFCLLSLVV